MSCISNENFQLSPIDLSLKFEVPLAKYNELHSTEFDY